MTTHEFGLLVTAVAVALIAVAIYTAGWFWMDWPTPFWLPRWRCVDGFWHWRKECGGHDMRMVRPEDPPVEWLAPGAPDWRVLPSEVSDGREDALDDAEAALDEAWPDTLHAINTDLHQPATDVLGLAHEPWIVRVMAEHWDWRQWSIADHEAASARHDAEHRHEVAKFNAGWKAHRLECGLEWRDDMGLAA